jgi:hypothetical protein
VSWEQLLSILKTDAAEREFWRNTPPVACPNDGTPLQEGPDGSLFCKHDGWAYPRDWVRPA